MKRNIILLIIVVLTTTSVVLGQEKLPILSMGIITKNSYLIENIKNMDFDENIIQIYREGEKGSIADHSPLVDPNWGSQILRECPKLIALVEEAGFQRIVPDDNGHEPFTKNAYKVSIGFILAKNKKIKNVKIYADKAGNSYYVRNIFSEFEREKMAEYALSLVIKWSKIEDLIQIQTNVDRYVTIWFHFDDGRK